MTPLSPEQWQAWLIQLRMIPEQLVFTNVNTQAWCVADCPDSIMEALGVPAHILVYCTRPLDHEGPHCDGFLNDYKMITWTSTEQFGETHW